MYAHVAACYVCSFFSAWLPRSYELLPCFPIPTGRRSCRCGWPQDAGIFKKYGLNVEIKTPNSGEAIADGARTNAADIYVATANWMVSAIGDGADLVFFANTGYSVLKLSSHP